MHACRSWFKSDDANAVLLMGIVESHNVTHGARVMVCLCAGYRIYDNVIIQINKSHRDEIYVNISITVFLYIHISSTHCSIKHCNLPSSGENNEYPYCA